MWRPCPAHGAPAIATPARYDVSGRADGVPLAGIRVACEPLDEDAFDDLPCFGATDASGQYSIGGQLLAGDYRVRFADPEGRYATEFFDDRVFREDADAVAAAPGAETTGIDAVLDDGAAIEGRVTREDGLFCPITSVTLLRQDPVSGEWRFVAGTTQLDDGVYRVAGVPAGTYRIRFRGSSFGGIQNADVEFFDNVADLEQAADVVLAAGELRTGLDAVLGDLEDEGRAANADFDEGLGGWSLSDESAVAHAAADVFADPSSGSIEIASDRSVTVSQCIAVAPGTEPIEVLASIRSEAAADVELWLQRYGAPACGGAGLGESRLASATATPSWQRLAGQVERAAGIETVRVELRVAAGSAPVQADAIDLRTAVPIGALFVDGFE